jgi:alpha-galactosidase
MKRYIVLIAFLIAATIVSGQQLSSPSDVKLWMNEHFAKGKTPPFSFTYGGRKSDTFIKSWQYSSVKLTSDEPQTEKYLYTYTDKNTGLSVRCTVTCFLDFPAIEWVLNFVNTSSRNTPLIESAAVVDQSFTANKQGAFHLHRLLGSNVRKIDFHPIYEEMQNGQLTQIIQTAGRSSDGDAFPFFNIVMPGSGGIVAAIGWTGSWFADLLPTGQQNINLKSGMGKMRITLYPKEEIRTPKICLLFWNGKERMVGHNQFRQFILEHHSRKINGTFAECPLSSSFDFGDPAPCGEYECLTEEFAIAIVKRYKQFNLIPEVFWLDAGWYTLNIEDGTWLHNIGNWSIDPSRFPNGLRPVADAVHATGAKFMVWFEPERVRPGSEMGLAHPEWLLQIPERESRVLNLGNPQALTWVTEHVTGFLKKEGVDYYRQDCNIDPLKYWDANDKPDRIGMSQIRHIEGLYAFWDSLLVRFPHLIIDNCASGGRRIDLETVSRSSPFWKSDYEYTETDGRQCHTYAMNFYLPIHGSGVYKTDNYTFRSCLGAVMVMNWKVTGREFGPIPMMQKRIEDFKALRPYYYGDFYPLTESNNYTNSNVWLAYQMNRPKEGDGFILAFRRSESPDNSIFITPSGLDDNSIYELFYEDYGIRIQKSGRELAQGFDIFIPEKHSSLMIRYQKVK